MIGVTRAAAVALGFKSLMADLGAWWPARVWTDSSASIGMCTRQGIGKVRHMDTQIMWIQQRVRNNDIDLYKVLGENNPADLMTKAEIPKERAQHLLDMMHCEFEGGRAVSAPKLRAEGGKPAFAAMPSRGGLARRKSCQPALKDKAEDDRLARLAEGAAKPVHWSWADETEAELQRGEQVQAGEPVKVPEAPGEVEELPDRLVVEGEKLGAAGRGREPLNFGRPT